MVSKVIAALQLIPPSKDSIASRPSASELAVSVSAASVVAAAANQAPEQSRKRREFIGLQLTPQSTEPVAAHPVAVRTDDSVAVSVDQAAQRPRKRPEFAGLQLTPQSNDHAAASGQNSAEPAEPKFWQRTKLRILHLLPATAGTVMLWVPAAAVILVMSFVGVLRLTEVLSPASHTSDFDQTTVLNVPPPTDTDEPAATESAPARRRQLPRLRPLPAPCRPQSPFPSPPPLPFRPRRPLPGHCTPQSPFPRTPQSPPRL